jgi:acyl-CoA synthetase (AMP-forming)/AMP-acid ligase II
LSIVDNILYHCRHQAPALALCAPGSTLHLVSYARLERFIHNVSRKAAAAGLARGQIVALLVADPILHTALILGLARLDVVTLSSHDLKLPQELRIAAVIADRPTSYHAPQLIRADFGWLEGDGKPSAKERLASTEANDVCRIVLTPDGRGGAGAVALTHRMIAMRIARHLTVFGGLLPRCSRTYCDLGFASALGFQFLIYALWRGGTMFFPGDSMESTIHAFDAYGVENIVSNPPELLRVSQFYEQHPSRQCKMAMLLSVGDGLPAEVSERARARLCANLLTVYGSPETSMVAGAPAHAITHVPNAAGYVMPEMSVEIVDAMGNVLPVDTEGMVRVRGPYNIDGYLNRVDATASAFRDRWFYSGDIGRLTTDNLLVISRRGA